MSPQQRGVRTKITNIQWQSRVSWWHCERRLWSLRSFYWTGLVCVPSDCRKSNGCYSKIARLWRTSRWCSICLHSSKVGGRSQIAQNAWVRMFRCLDTSSTTQMANIEGEHWRFCGTSRTKYFWTPIGRIVLGKTIRGSSIGIWMGKISNWECLFVHRNQGLLLPVYVDDVTRAGKEQNMAPMWKKWMKKRWSWRTNFISWSRKFEMYSTWMHTEWNYYWRIFKDVWITYFLLEQQKNYQGVKSLTQRRLHGPTTWKDMLENALSDTVNWQTKKVEQLYKVSSLCWDDHQFKQEELESVGELSKVCSQIVLKCWCLARIGRPDILWSVNKFARAVTKWTQACDKLLVRFTSFIHHTSEFRQYRHVGNAAQLCRLVLFQDSDFAGDLEDTKSTSGGVLWIFGSRTLVTISWMCKKLIAVSHSSTESEIISLGAGLRMDGLLALDLRDMVIEVWRSTNNTARKGIQAQGDLCGTGDHSINKNKTKIPTEKRTREVEQLSIVDYVPAPTHILLKARLSCTFLKTTKLSSRLLSKDEVQHWDTCPEPTELHLIGCSTESSWKQRSKSNMLTPKINSLTR